jgi:1-acyl-sn-glycerol-3-phosphate acyltransferase
MIRKPLRVARAATMTAALAGGLVAEERLRNLSAERREAYVRRWARAMLRALRVEVVVEGKYTPSERPQLVVANHRSTLDIFLMLSLFGGHLLARGDMESWPAVGWLAQKAGTLFVDRSDAGSGATAVRKITDHLRRGRVIGVFPEGPTFNDDEVRPFHAGAFMAIARVRGDVTPVGIAYDDSAAHYVDEPISAHFERLLTTRRTRVAVTIGEPLACAGVPIHETKERAQAAVQALVYAGRRRLTSA